MDTVASSRRIFFVMGLVAAAITTHRQARITTDRRPTATAVPDREFERNFEAGSSPSQGECLGR